MTVISCILPAVGIFLLVLHCSETHDHDQKVSIDEIEKQPIDSRIFHDEQ